MEPAISVIRLMWNIAREDEHFLVLGENQIEGISNLPAHAGRKGIYDPKDILDKKDSPLWEAHSLNPYPKPRKVSRGIHPYWQVF